MLVNPKYTEPPLTVPLDAPTEVSAEAENAQVTIKWTDPKNKYATPEGEEAQDPQQLVAVWDHTVLVRKVGSNPTGPSDGTVVVSTTVRNQYQTTGYTDTGLVNDTSYHYGVFSFNEDGVASAGAFVEATPIAGTPLSQLAEGTLIKILENGSPVEFYLAKHSYEPSLNGEGRELLVRKDIHSNQGWNGLDDNYWIDCSLMSWLNSTYKATLSATVQQLMGTTAYVTEEVYPSASYSNSVFILSLTEYGLSQTFVDKEGSELPIASSLRVAYLDGSPSPQWTRSRVRNNTVDVAYITADGGTSGALRNRAYGARPCFTLPDTARVDAELNLIEE